MNVNCRPYPVSNADRQNRYGVHASEPRTPHREDYVKIIASEITSIADILDISLQG